MPSAYAPAVGGVEELTARLAHRLMSEGDDVEVWTTRHPPELPPTETIDRITVRRLLMPMPRLSARALTAFPRDASRAWTALRAVADSFGPDVLHVQCFSANGAWASRLAASVRAPLIVTLQGETVMDDHDIYDTSLTMRAALRRGLSTAAAVTACSRFVLADAEKRFGLELSRGCVIPNGIELDEGVAPLPLTLPFKRFVLALGRIVHKKGFDLLVEAFKRVAPRHEHLGLVIGGDGPARAALERAVAAAGLADRVVLPGALSRENIAWVMASAELFVMPSRIEPFGIVALEALRAGLPTIVSSRGGASEIVRDAVDGLVVDPFDTAKLAAAIERLLTDRPFIAALGKAGHTRATSYDWSIIAKQYRAIYELSAT
jgi:glycosyltransferase involved in cell wall biosynthesis